MDSTGYWVVAFFAAFVVGMGKGGLPIVGMLGVPVMALYMSPVMAAGLLLPVYVVSDMFGLYAYRHEFSMRVLKIVIPGMIAGVGVGWATASIVPEWAVTALVGAIGLAFSLNILLRGQVKADPRPAKVAPGLFWGSIAGFTSFVSHTGGPPYQIYTLPLGMSKTMFAGTSTIAFAVVNAVKLIPYYYLGQLNPSNLRHAVVLMPIAAVAVFTGVKLVKILPEKLFFSAVTWALLIVSVKLLYDGLFA